MAISYSFCESISNASTPSLALSTSNPARSATRVRSFRMIRSSRGLDRAICAAIEDPAGIQNGDAQLMFELLQQAEHPVDRATGRLASLVDSDHQKTSMQQVAGRRDRHVVGGPAVEERIHSF